MLNLALKFCMCSSRSVPSISVSCSANGVGESADVEVVIRGAARAHAGVEMGNGEDRDAHAAEGDGSHGLDSGSLGATTDRNGTGRVSGDGSGSQWWLVAMWESDSAGPHERPDESPHRVPWVGRRVGRLGTDKLIWRRLIWWCTGL